MSKLRVQIQLEPAERDALQAHARRRGVSMSQAAREAIREALGLSIEAGEAARARFLAASGCVQEPDHLRDVARRHDEVLYGPSR